MEDKSSETIRSEITKENVTTALGYTPYTPNEVDNKFSALETNIDWKEAVDTFADIAVTYPSPEDGWTVNVKDTDYTYRYNGSEWVAISANAIPKATNSVDGLLSKEDHAKYDDAASKAHTHDNKSVLDGITSDKVTAWDTVNNKVDKVDGKGLSTNDYTTDEKNKLSGIATGANKTIVDSALNTSSENPVQNKVIAGEINTLKKSVSDGKTLVATAITDKGVDTAADATFAIMAENISQIETGGGELHGATISVTTSEENPTTITVTLTRDSTTIEQKNFDSNGMCTFTDIQESGDYTVAVSDGTYSSSTTATVTGDNIVNKTVISVTIEFTLDGSTATPLNDVSIWLRTDSTGSSKKAGHTTLAQVIADPDTLNNLMRDQSAMQYLARSTGFADEGCASETFMTYLGASTYVDSTVLNSDLWVDAIGNSTYWRQVSKTVTLHGGASESITVDGNTLVTTNSDGSVTTSVPYGTHDYTGVISSQSFSRTVGKDTTDVYVMPEGALYWYGNECEWLSGGWMKSAVAPENSEYNTFAKQTNDLLIRFVEYARNTSHGHNVQNSAQNKNLVDLSRYSKIKFTATTISKSNIVGVYSLIANFSNSNYEIICNIVGNTGASATNKTYEKDISDITDLAYVNFYSHILVGITGYIYSVWFE